ncbi:cytochrome p450 [Trifolium pratense]|uniref:Cytochrome p450 n=1 Tax=Trifolium pratense TaxID=57577 RepID=A0A2K3N210_TRIPR|nr:cytochrome p450 [Trifolium pratense]
MEKCNGAMRSPDSKVVTEVLILERRTSINPLENRNKVIATKFRVRESVMQGKDDIRLKAKCLLRLRKFGEASGNWHQIWRAKIPPKVKNLLWRIGRNALPTRARLNSRGVQCPEHCAVCNDGTTSFSVLLGSIWKRRNGKVWNNITESNITVCERARHLITSWTQAQQTDSYANTPEPIQQHTNWEKPSRRRYKCNIDASFSSTHNKVGIGMCIRDDQGRYVATKTEWLEPILDVEIGEATGLLTALKWVGELQLRDVNFEMDCKRVVDCLYSSKTYNSDLGDILRDCRIILVQGTNEGENEPTLVEVYHRTIVDSR